MRWTSARSLLAGRGLGLLLGRNAASARLARARGPGTPVRVGRAAGVALRLRTPAVAVVGGVEAAALELDTDRVEQLPQGAAALGTHLQRLRGHALEHLQLVAAFSAPVSVDRHVSPRGSGISLAVEQVEHHA